MKELNELSFPDDVRYAKDHEWTRVEGDTVRVGVSDYAQDRLGDITFVEMPQVGDFFDRGQEFGTLESTKAVGEIFLPIAGEVLEVNVTLADSPEFINQDPYGQGWILVIKPQNPEEVQELMNRDAYVEMLRGLD
jgi:glycine cleavage system H protein